MTKEEKQKAIDAIKISAPFMAMTQEEYNIYIQTRIKLINWLEQEPCEDAISRQAVLELLKNTNNDWIINKIQKLPPVSSSEKPKSEWQHDHEILKAYSDGANEVLDKIRAEIEGLTYYWCEVNPKSVIDDVLHIIDKYKAEGSEE